MAWFHKTLKDMKVAIEKEDWDEVVKILAQHNRKYPTKEVEHDITNITARIKDYEDALSNIFSILRPYMRKEINPKGGALDILDNQADKAINAAYFFEKTIKHLIKEGKFME